MVLKVAVVGCGYWGKNLVRNFAELGVLAAVCDANQTLAQNTGDQYGVPVLSFEDLLKNPDIKGVVIAAPATQHGALARRVIEAGKAVFVEKPLALDLQEATALCHLAKAKQVVLMVGHLLQYHSAFHGILDLMRKGTLGKLCYIYSNRLNFGKIRTEENILWSFAPHDISMILALAGDIPEMVSAIGSSYLNSHIQDITTTHLTFKNGIRAHIFVSWLHPFKEQKLVVVGDRGMAVFDDGLSWERKLTLYPHKIGWENGAPSPSKAEHVNLPIEPLEPLKQECQHFLDCIEKNKTPLTDGLEGLRVLRVLDAATRSLETHQPISLKGEPLKDFFVHETSCVDSGCQIGAGTQIWRFSHIRSGVRIGQKCRIGQNVLIGPDVSIGNNCKIQTNVALYQGVTLEDDVFCGPSCVFTNVRQPRSGYPCPPEEFLKTYVEKGVTIGANATIVCGIRLGTYSFIGAGTVVLQDVKPHALMVGNPARQIGWMSHAGEKLDERLICPREGRRYRLTDNQFLEEVTA